MKSDGIIQRVFNRCLLRPGDLAEAVREERPDCVALPRWSRSWRSA
jgi:hypothetical protein